MSKKSFRKQALGPFFWIFLVKKLPLAYLAGVKLKQIDDQGSTTYLKFRWINQNPFRSIYFAAMQMAAELATGLLLFQYMSKDTRFSMLLLKVEANYYKKAVGGITFKCPEGQRVEDFIGTTLKTNEGDMINLAVSATNEKNVVVADFIFSWSCKKT
jgi:hypothetical protein